MVLISMEVDSKSETARRWEAYALKILWAFLGVLSILFWDMRREITEIRRVQDQNVGLTKQLEVMIKNEQDHAIRLAIIEQEIKGFHVRLGIHSQRITTVARRIDQLPGGRIPIDTEDPMR